MLDNQAKDDRGRISGRAGVGVPLEELATTETPFLNGQLSVTTVGQIRSIGMDVIPDPTSGNPYHISIVPINTPMTTDEANLLSKLFKHIINSWKPKK